MTGTKISEVLRSTRADKRFFEDLYSEWQVAWLGRQALGKSISGQQAGPMVLGPA